MRTLNHIKNFSATIFRYILTLLASIYTRKLFIDTLGVEYLGVTGLMSNILGMLSIAELGIGSSIVFSLYSPLAHGDQNKVHLLIDLYKKLYRYIACFIFIVGLILLPFLSNISPELKNIPYYYVIYLMFLANSVIPYFFTYNSSLYSANQQSYKLENIRTFFYCLTTLATILVLHFLPNYILLTACTMGLGILSQFVIYFLARRRWPWLTTSPSGCLEKEDTDIIKKNVRAMVLHKIGDYSINGTSNLIIANAVNLTTVGLLGNYTIITGTIKTITQNFFISMTAGIGELIAISPKEKVYAVFQEMNFLAFWFFGLAMVGTYFCIDSVLIIWLGTNFELPRLAVLFISIDLFVLGMRVPPHIIKSGAGMYANDQFSPLFQAAINLSIGIWLANIWGVEGVTLAILLSGLCVPSWFRPYVVYRDYFKYPFRKYLGTYLLYASFLTIILLLLEYIFSLYLPHNDLSQLIYRLIVVLILFHIGIIAIGLYLPQGKMAFSRFHNIITSFYNKLCKKK